MGPCRQHLSVKFSLGLFRAVLPHSTLTHYPFHVMKLTFRGIQFFGSSLYTGQILGILCLQIDLFLIVECIWYNLGHACISQCMGFN